MVSVIIPLYNKAEFIGQCLASVFAQTYKELFEVIVIDDGSTDDGYAEAYRWPVRILRISSSGPSFARNLGFAYSTGDFILPLDADDWIDPTYLEKTVPLMENGVGIVSTDMVRFGKVNDVLPARPLTVEEEKNANEIPCCSLIRREAFLQAEGYNSQADGYEDWDLWIDILKRGWKMAVINEPLFHYRVLGNSNNARADEKREELIKAIHGLHPEIY